MPPCSAAAAAAAVYRCPRRSSSKEIICTEHFMDEIRRAARDPRTLSSFQMPEGLLQKLPMPILQRSLALVSLGVVYDCSKETPHEAVAAGQRRLFPSAGVALLSCPTCLPLAYHSLTTSLLVARCAELTARCEGSRFGVAYGFYTNCLQCAYLFFTLAYQLLTISLPFPYHLLTGC